MALILTDTDMQELLSYPGAVEALRAALEEQAEGTVQMPPRQTTDVAGSPNWLRVSAAFLGGRDRMGLKSMNRAAGIGMHYLVALYRISTGDLLALMDADALTTHRTAATNALGTHLLAPPAAATVAVIGSGVQARAFVRAYAELRSLQRVTVFSPRPESRRAFTDFVRAELGVESDEVETPAEAAERSDVVVMAMRAPKEPVFEPTWLRPGMHVTGLSSVRWDAREFHYTALERADLVVVDDRGTVGQSGDGLSVASNSSLDLAQAPELWELAAGQVGRSDPGQVTVFKSAGNCLQDLAVACDVYDRAVAEGRGTGVDDFPHVKPYD